jgi:EAL domain-containing protein (putative c-di-GMP-specific phosphodiesterase class I)
MLRLKTNSGELREAGQFLPSAVRQGRTAEIDLIALDLALAFADVRHCDVAINVSPRSLAQEDFFEKFRQRLAQAQHLTRRLWVEVSERGLDLSSDLGVLQQLAELLEQYDAHLGIEHFGGHFSSIWPQLYALKIHYVKLDGSFVGGIDLHPGNQRFVKAVVEMTHRMGIDVIAERVSTREEWKTLANIGVRGVTGPAVTSSFGIFSPTQEGRG